MILRIKNAVIEMNTNLSVCLNEQTNGGTKKRKTRKGKEKRKME